MQLNDFKQKVIIKKRSFKKTIFSYYSLVFNITGLPSISYFHCPAQYTGISLIQAYCHVDGWVVFSQYTVNLEQFSKAYISIDNTLSGITILVRLVQFSKALLKIYFTPLGIIIDFKLMQLTKVKASISLIVFDKTIFYKLLHWENANNSIVVWETILSHIKQYIKKNVTKKI